ncbi:C39 family peptidase [Parasphingorhabdus sp. JC815]|uniref:C39 family peptidase n=1 Tax=Parasphingorhabdus sp. JC815 TaxID=3232140 RepID=UPI00345926BB
MSWLTSTRVMKTGSLYITACLCVGSLAHAQSLPIPLAGTGQIRVNVTSLADMRFRNMTRQSQDLSCGAAAVATLLTYAYDMPRDERTIINSIFEGVPEEAQKKIAAQGFSLLELKRYLETQGFIAGGFEMKSVEKLVNLKVPVIALVNVRGYNHFVVIKRVHNGRVLIADPAFGNTRPTMEAFASQWNGIILAVVKQGTAPQPVFMEDPTILARPSDLRSISVALGAREIKLPGEF